METNGGRDRAGVSLARAGGFPPHHPHTLRSSGANSRSSFGFWETGAPPRPRPSLAKAPPPFLNWGLLALAFALSLHPFLSRSCSLPPSAPPQGGSRTLIKSLSDSRAESGAQVPVTLKLGDEAGLSLSCRGPGAESDRGSLLLR